MLLENCSNFEQILENNKHHISNLITARELLGCHYIDKARSFAKGLTAWKDAIILRTRFDQPKASRGYGALNPTILMLKSIIREMGWKEEECELSSIFITQDEFSSLEQLFRMIQEPETIKAQSMVVRLRILGPDHPDTCSQLRQRGAQMADNGDWNTCIKTWIIVMLFNIKCKEPICGTVLQHFQATIQLFQHMLVSNITNFSGTNLFPLKDLVRVIEGAFYECRRYYVTKKACDDDVEPIENRIYKMYRYTLVLLAFALMCKEPRLKHYVKDQDCGEALYRLKKVVWDNKDLRLIDERTLMHLSCSEPAKPSSKKLDGIDQIPDNEDDITPLFIHGVDDENHDFLKYWLRLPNVHVVKFLYENGHSVTTLDHEYNSPLHIACKQRAGTNLVSFLAKKGKNQFDENKYGKTPYYYLKRSFAIKNINEKRFYDDGPLSIDVNGEVGPRNTTGCYF